MAEEDHEELSPLHRLAEMVRLRLESNECVADKHPDHEVRRNGKIRAEVYRLMRAEIEDAIADVAKTQVDRIIARRNAAMSAAKVV